MCIGTLDWAYLAGVSSLFELAHCHSAAGVQRSRILHISSATSHLLLWAVSRKEQILPGLAIHPYVRHCWDLVELYLHQPVHVCGFGICTV